MADSIKIGNLDINAFKVGAADCSIYLGDVKLYPQGSQPFKYKFKLDDTSVVTAECDSSSAITSAETSVYKTRLVEAEVGDCVTSLGEKAFYFMDSIFTSVTIPNSVTSIGNNAFAWDSGLVSVEIPNSVTNIGNNAFDSCSSLSSITIPDSVTNIGSYAFAYCYSLTSVTIGSGVTSIGNRAFNNNSGLTSVTIEAVTPPTLVSDAFNNTNNCPIYVPAESVNAYKTAWSSYADRIVAIQSSTCYEIISELVTAYTSTTYDSVYSTADEKWYMLNNLNQYEEYGVYDIVEDIASATTYEGKLGVVGETEYQYSGGSWSVVGSYVDSSVTYTIDNTSPSPYVGQELSTTFKIPLADITGSSVSFRIYAEGGYLDIRVYKTSSLSIYRYSGNGSYTGTVTKDGEYAYLSLPSEAPQSIVIDMVEYWNSTPIHIIVGSKQATVEYVEKAVPSVTVYANVTELEAATCPTVGVGQYGFVGTDLYKYFASEEWDGVSYYEPKMVAFYGEGNPMVVYKNGNTVLSQSETKIKDISPVSVYIGDSVSSIGENAFNDDSYPYENLITAVTFSENSQLTSIGGGAFQSCSGLTSVTIPNSVTSIGYDAFQGCSGITSISIPSGVTNIGNYAFAGCSSLTSITVPTGAIYLSSNSFAGTPWWNTYSADTSHQYSSVVYLNNVAMCPINSGITNVSFKEETIGIANNAFQNKHKLTNVTIIEGVETIGAAAFNSCSGLTSVTIPDSVKSIGGSAFNSSLNLKQVYVFATTPPTLGTFAFHYTYNSLVIYVPAQSVDAYKTATNWSDYASRIQAMQT